MYSDLTTTLNVCIHGTPDMLIFFHLWQETGTVKCVLDDTFSPYGTPPVSSNR